METDRAGEGPVYCKPVHCLTHEPSSGMSAIWTTSTSAGRSLTLLGFSTGRWKKETPSRCRWVRPPYSLKLLLLSAFTHASIRPRHECLSLVRSIRHTRPPHSLCSPWFSSEHHGSGPSEGSLPVHRRRQRAMWLHHCAAVGAVPLDQAALLQQAHPRHLQQDR